MLRQVADGVHVHESSFCQSNTVVVEAADGVLLVDPGILVDELECLVRDLAALGKPVTAGFSTHPHWDHMLWHPALGDVPRYSTALAASVAKDRLSGGVEAAVKAAGAPDGIPVALLGEVTGLPDGTVEIPWDGPVVRIIEHEAHAPGHAALVIGGNGVLVAGDMLSDGFIPMLNAFAAAPFEDYLDALRLFESVESTVDVVIPGHGSVGGAAELRSRIDQDRTYVLALRDGFVVSDPRIGPTAKPGWAWVSTVHEAQLNRLASRK